MPVQLRYWNDGGNDRQRPAGLLCGLRVGLHRKRGPMPVRLSGRVDGRYVGKSASLLFCLPGGNHVDQRPVLVRLPSGNYGRNR